VGDSSGFRHELGSNQKLLGCAKNRS
jgi:hypothetical protein